MGDGHALVESAVIPEEEQEEGSDVTGFGS
jgi:hypothetical protein